MASIACRMAGDASSNFNATLMVQTLIFDTSLSILELTPNKSFGVIQRPAQIRNPGRRDGVCAILVFLNLLEGHTEGITQVGLGQSQL